MKLGQYRDISCPGQDVFLKIIGGIPGMFLHYFQIITTFLYVCQSFSWLNYLLKLGQYRDISCSRWDIFQKFLGGISRIFLHYFKINTNCLYGCQSVRWLTFLLKLGQYRDISSSRWDIFLKIFWDVPRIFQDNFQIMLNFLCVCQCVSWLTSLLKLG